jgi:glycosyltransferase involved in cell wall biosynthesis
VRFTFVNDGSTDGTLRVIEDLASQRPNKISVHHLSRNHGKAEAVRKGMLHVIKKHNLTYNDVVAFWDADLATPLSAISQFVGKLSEHPQFEMVFGARVSAIREPCNSSIDSSEHMYGLKHTHTHTHHTRTHRTHTGSAAWA